MDTTDMDDAERDTLATIARTLRKDGWAKVDELGVHRLRTLARAGLIDLVPSLSGGFIARPTKAGLEALQAGKAKAPAPAADVAVTPAVYGGWGHPLAPLVAEQLAFAREQTRRDRERLGALLKDAAAEFFGAAP